MTSIVEDYKDSTMQQCPRAHSFREAAALGGSIRQVKEEEETVGKAKWAATADWSLDPPLNATSAERAIYELVRSPYNSDCWNTPGRHIFFNPRLVTVPFSSPSLPLSLHLNSNISFVILHRATVLPHITQHSDVIR